jgi:ABC transporter substrate binding protein
LHFHQTETTAATQSIPIVFLSGSDPIAAGLVSSIYRPTSNVTSIAPMFTLLGGKNLELLHDLGPWSRGESSIRRAPDGRDERLDLLPPRYSISEAQGVGSWSQAEFLLSPERLSPPGAFFIHLALLKKPRPRSGRG